jgi:hypothetical protein
MLLVLLQSRPRGQPQCGIPIAEKGFWSLEDPGAAKSSSTGDYWTVRKFLVLSEDHEASLRLQGDWQRAHRAL